MSDARAAEVLRAYCGAAGEDLALRSIPFAPGYRVSWSTGLGGPNRQTSPTTNAVTARNSRLRKPYRCA